MRYYLVYRVEHMMSGRCELVCRLVVHQGAVDGSMAHEVDSVHSVGNSLFGSGDEEDEPGWLADEGSYIVDAASHKRGCFLDSAEEERGSCGWCCVYLKASWGLFVGSRGQKFKPPVLVDGLSATPNVEPLLNLGPTCRDQAQTSAPRCMPTVEDRVPGDRE
jgi:hypothetical protein